jgi:hypothetical protein
MPAIKLIVRNNVEQMNMKESLMLDGLQRHLSQKLIRKYTILVRVTSKKKGECIIMDEDKSNDIMYLYCGTCGKYFHILLEENHITNCQKAHNYG